MSRAAQAVADILLYEAAYKRFHRGRKEVRVVLVADDQYELHRDSGNNGSRVSLEQLRTATERMDRIVERRNA